MSALALLAALLLSVTSAEAARPRADRVLSDVFEARSFWGKTLENTPRRGYSTDVATIADVRSGFTTARGKEVPFRRVCLSIQRHVTDPHGESVINPQHMFAADEGCVDIDASSGRIARNLSSAYVSAVRIPLLHSYSVCPDWPSFEGCSFETSPGSRTVRFDAAWTPIGPLHTDAFCSRNINSLVRLRLADAVARVNGVGVGEAHSGDEGVRIVRFTKVRGCAGRR